MLEQSEQMVYPGPKFPSKTSAAPYQSLYAASIVGKRPTGKFVHVAP